MTDTAVPTETLTLSQKASLLSGADFWTTKAVADAGIPSLVLTDGPHGVRRQIAGSDHLGLNASEPATCFPPATAVGSSWNPQVATRLGAALAVESRALGVNVLLGPGVNIKRSPLCGRNFEYYSEDPLLAGVLGAAHVSALQAGGVGASVKHFAANNQETDRMRVSAEVDERTLREIYFPAFERVVTEARPATVMCSYNRVNGVHASQNRWLLTDVLRGDWGFDGAVVSDWGAVVDRVAAVAAGMDLEMPGTGGTSDAAVVAAVEAGELSEADVDISVARLRGLAAWYAEAAGEIDVDAHHALARELAAECIVLLRNEGGVLPLTGGRIAVFGASAVEPLYQGGGSSHIITTRLDVPLTEIQRLAASRGGEVVDATAATAADAAALLGAADVAVVFAAAAPDTEGADRDALELPADQIALIEAVAATAARTVVVLSNGGVVSVEGWHDKVDAIVEGWLLGQAAGGAIADVLFGEVNPSGHLAETVPTDLRQTPAYLNFPGEQGAVRYGEGVFVGYRHHSTTGFGARYPFGHGLSYTTFRTDALTVTVTGEGTATAEVTVRNTGDRAGQHVVQLYVATEAGPVRRPARELRAFEKVSLQPGETTTVAFALDRRAFSYWDVVHGRWVVAPGSYTVEIGADAETVLRSETIALDGEVIVAALSMDSTVGEWMGHPVAGPILQQAMTAGMTAEQAAQAEDNADQLSMIASMSMRQFSGFFGGAIPQSFFDDLIAQSIEHATA